jgi:hypothetical protein
MHLASVCRLIDLNPPAKVLEQARQVLTACEKSPTDAVRINYDPRNPFDICSITFTPIYKGSKYAEDPYTGEGASSLLSILSAVKQLTLVCSHFLCCHCQRRLCLLR